MLVTFWNEDALEGPGGLQLAAPSWRGILEAVGAGLWRAGSGCGLGAQAAWEHAFIHSAYPTVGLARCGLGVWLIQTGNNGSSDGDGLWFGRNPENTWAKE